MLAVSLTQSGAEMTELPRPVIESPNDAVLMVTTAAIGPWEIVASASGGNAGTVPGAQFVGVVVELGEAVMSVQIDDLVAATAAVPTAQAHHRFGSVQLHGGHAEYVRVPDADMVLVKTTASAEERSVFAGGAAAFGAATAREVQAEPNERILAAGCDATVLATLAFLRLSNTPKNSQLSALDQFSARLAAAKAYGAGEITLDDSGNGDISTVLIGSGLPDEILAELSGKLGDSAKFVVTSPGLGIEHKIAAEHVSTVHWANRKEAAGAEMAIRLRRLDLTPLVSTVLPLDEAEQAYQMALESPPGTRSVLLKP